MQRMRAQVAFALRRGERRAAAPAAGGTAAGAPGRRAGPADLSRSPGGRDLRRPARPWADARRSRAPRDPQRWRRSSRSRCRTRSCSSAAWPLRLADGYLAAAPALKEALRRYRAQPQELDWLSRRVQPGRHGPVGRRGVVRARGRPGPAGAGDGHPQLASVRARLPRRDPHPGGRAVPGGGLADRARARRPGDQGGHVALRPAAARGVARGRDRPRPTWPRR